MRAIVIAAAGGPEVMTLGERPIPTPGPGSALVRQTVAGINYIDTSVRGGRIPHALPFTPGREGIGTIAALGEGVTEFAVGDRVGYSETPDWGGYAEYNVVPTGELVPIPPDVDDAVAAALMLQGITAHYLTHTTFPLGPQHTILAHAAAGGVGSLLVQLAKLRGARVIATAGGAEKVALARANGADEVIDYTTTEFAPEVRRLTDGVGVDVVYDAVGAATFDGSIASLRRRGMLIMYGAASGRIPPLDIQRLGTAGSLFITRPTATDYKREKSELLGRVSDLFTAVKSGGLNVRIGGRYPLADAAEAHRALEARETTGKLVLTI
jgi:NADPH2:quinone reductase